MPASAFVSLFPFDLLTCAESRVAPQRLTVGGIETVLYWPFWHEEGPGRRLPVIRSAAIPSRSSAPFFQVAPLELHIEVLPPPGHSFANALRVDVLQDADEELVTNLITDILRQFRVLTNQWWIGHAHREGEGLVRVAYNIDDQGFLAGQDCRAGAVVEPRLRIERPLTPVHFATACTRLAGGRTVPAHWDVFYDAIYFGIHRQDWRRALLDACIACDLGVLYEALRAGQSTGKPEQVVRSVLSDRDLLVNLRQGLSRLFGPNADFSQTNKADYDLIRRLWAARGSIAHGHVPTTGNFGRAYMPSRTEAAELVMAAMRLLAWLANLPHSDSYQVGAV